MTAISKNVYFDVLDDIVNKYNNTVHRTIKMKPIDVTGNSYAEYNEDFNKKYPKFKAGDHVRISKYKIFLLKDTLQIGQKKFLLLVKLKIQFLRHMLLVYWMVKKLLEVFMKKNCKKTNQKKFIIEKILKRKDDKLYIKWKGYDNFKSWINKKDLIQKWVNNFLSRLEVLEEI